MKANAESLATGTHEQVSRRRLLSLAAAGGVGAALPGLFGTRAVDAATARAAASANVMQSGSTLALALNAVSDIKNFNQAIVYDSASWFASTCIFSRLTVMDYGPAFDIHPQLAHEWEISDDARVYTFHLVDNATWHDGEPVTSADVKMTYEGIVEQEGPAAAFLSGIEQIETPDDYSLTITLKEPDASFLYSISVYPRMPILPRHLYEGTDWKTHPNNLSPIGSGPFKFQEMTPGDRFILVANDDYFEGRPNLDMVVGKFIPDQRTALAALQAGEYGALNGPPPLQLIQELQANPNIEVEAPAGPWGFYIGFNMTKEPLDNVDVRQALATAINREDVTNKVTGGVAPVSNGPYVQGIEWAFDPSVQSPAFDPARAEEMLDAAGLAPDGDGVRARLRLFAISDELYPLVADVVKEHLRAIGVEVEIELMDNPTFHEVMPRLEHDLVVYALWIGPDPNEWKQQLLKDGFRNWFGYDNPEVAELFAEGVRSPDRDIRKVSYYKIQEIVNRDMPRINLFDAPYSFAHTTAFTGFFSQEGTISYRMDLTKVTRVG